MIQDGSPSNPFRFPQSPLVNSSGNSQIVTMLQQQQSVLQKVLDSQKNLEERQNNMEAQLFDIQANISLQCSSSDSGNDRKRKRTVTRALSVSVDFNYVFILPLISSSFTCFNRRKCIQYTMQVIYSLNQVNRMYLVACFILKF